MSEEGKSSRRFGQVIKIKPDKLEYYRQLHREPWPCVLDTIRECHITNYSIYLHGDLLFACFEYTGEDFAADMKKMAEDECTRQWWKETAPCQESLKGFPDGGWLDLEELFHAD